MAKPTRAPALGMLARRQLYRMLLARDGTWCHWCGVRLVTGLPVAPADGYTRDHLVPRAAGGTDELANLVPACQWCNSRRNAMSALEWEASDLLAARRVEVAASA